MESSDLEKKLSESNVNVQKLIRYRLQNIDQLNTNGGYFRETFLKHKIRNICIFIFSFLVIFVEFFYREPLFNYSLDFEEKWQKNSPDGLIDFFKIITKYGGEYLMAFPVFVVIAFFSIVKAVIYITGFVFCLSFHCLLKMWYGNPRPFWENPNLYKNICDAGFGNPSGHSMITTYLYLALFIILKDTKYVDERFHIQSILLIVSLIWTIAVILSRLILGMHSVNQVIYGATFGLVVVFNMFLVFRLHKMPAFFYKRLFKNIKYNIIIFTFLFLYTILAIISKFVCNQDFDKEKYNNVINETCITWPEYRRFNNDGLYGSLFILSLVGLYFGQIFFWYLVKNNYTNRSVANELKNQEKEIENNNKNVNNNVTDDRYDSLCEVNVPKNQNWVNQDGDSKEDLIVDELINHWNDNRIFMWKLTNILKIICILIVCSIPVVLFILVGGDNLLLIYIFKFGVPFVLVFFLIFGPGFYYVIKITCGPREIILKQIFMEESNENTNRGDLGISNSKDNP